MRLCLSAVLSGADEEPQRLSLRSRLHVSLSGVCQNGLGRASSSCRRQKTGQGVDFRVCQEETGLSPPHLNLQTSCFYLDCWAVYTLPRSRGVFTHRAWPDWQPLSPPQQRRSERLCRLSGVGLPCWMPLSVFSARCHLPRPTIWNLLWLSIYYKRK